VLGAQIVRTWRQTCRAGGEAPQLILTQCGHIRHSEGRTSIDRNFAGIVAKSNTSPIWELGAIALGLQSMPSWADLGLLGFMSITVWKDVELYERGLKDFASLTPLERDYFVIKDLDIYYEMEGGFEDYILSGAHTSQLIWLEDALRRIGDIVSAGIITELRSMNESRRSEMKPLCDRYFGRRHQ